MSGGTGEQSGFPMIHRIFLRLDLMDMAGGEFYNKIVLKITELFKEASGWFFLKNSQLFCA